MELRGRMLAFIEYREMLLNRVDSIRERNKSKRVKPNIADRIKESNISKYVNFFSINYYCDTDREIAFQMTTVYQDLDRVWPKWEYIKQLLETVRLDLEYEFIISEIEVAIENEELDHIKKRQRKFGLFPKMDISKVVISKINLLQRKALKDANDIVTNTISSINPRILLDSLHSGTQNQGTVSIDIT